MLYSEFITLQIYNIKIFYNLNLCIFYLAKNKYQFFINNFFNKIINIDDFQPILRYLSFEISFLTPH